MIIKSNTWKIFYLIFVGALILLITLLYISYTDISKRYSSQLEHYTQIIAKTVSSNFLQKDMILNLVGKQLLKDDNYKNTKKSKLILDDLLAQNSYIVGFGLLDIDGNFLVTSSNIKNTKKINLLENEVSKYDFQKALDSKEMVVGRTVFFKPLNEWVIPIRKAIRDENGNAIGVMTAGIRNKKNTHYLDSLKLSKEKIVYIGKDYDHKKNMYIQYVSQNMNIKFDDLYNTPISKNKISSIEKNLNKNYEFGFNELRTNEKIVSISFLDRFETSRVSGITYDSLYDLWILVIGDTSLVWEEFQRVLIIYLGVFIFSFIVFYTLFKNIVTAEIRKREELIYLSEHDVLTSLPNRQYMYDHIDEWMLRHDKQFSVLYLDLDNFKNINDRFGHTIGDEILVEVSKRLTSFFKNDEMLIRQGGDEFIVLKDCSSELKLEESFSELIVLISEVYFVDNKEFRIGMSVGASQYPSDSTSIEELLSFADTAMYEAKKRKNSYCLFSERMRHSSVVKTDIEQELRGALNAEELWMVYQPQINGDGSLYGVEALVRWKNEKLGFVGPDKFIQVAEETGLMRELGEFIISTAMREINTIQKKLDIVFSLSINISVIQLIESDFLDNLLSIIKEVDFDKSILTLEITESLSIEDLDDVLPLLHSIREEGIEISLDDFGTGYSSLSILRDLPINELKIDKSFVDKILYDESEKALIHSIINIGRNFGMKTLSEGVENFEQVEELKQANCDIFQGYYYSKPLIPEDLISYLKKNVKVEA